MRWIRLPGDWQWLLPFVIALVTFLPGLHTPGLYDPNEGLYAEIAWEMFSRGDWLTPRFNGVPYFEKPPLLYWLIATSYTLFGVSEATARLPVALSAVAGVFTTFAIGRALWSPRAGVLAALVLSTSFGYFIFARIILTDLLFTACVTAALWAFLRGYLDPARGRWYLLVYVFSGLAVLAKGLLGLAIPVLIVGSLMVVTREPGLLRELRLRMGALLFLTVAVPWHLAVGRANEEFFWFYFVNEHVLRFLNMRHLIDYAPLPVWLFLLMALVWSSPWSAFLPFAWRELWPRDGGTKRDRAGWIVPCWIVAVLGFFALTPARLEYYSLPALPALALWVGRFWDQVLQESTRLARLRWVLAGFLALSAGLVPLVASFGRLKGVQFYNIFPALDAYSRDIQHGILAQPGFYTVPSFREILPPLVAAAAVVVSGAAGGFLAALLSRPRLAFACVAGLMLGIFPLIHQGLVLFEPHRSVRELAQKLNRVERTGDLIVVEGPYENFAALNLYTRRSSLVLNGRFGDLEFGSRRPDAARRFLDDAGFDQLWRSERRVFLLTGSSGRVESLSRQVPVAILGRAGHKWLLVNRL